MEVLRLHREGESLRGICRTLMDAGIDYRGHDQWHPQTVSNIITRWLEAAKTSEIERDRKIKASTV